jgi:hypothetical protein
MRQFIDETVKFILNDGTLPNCVSRVLHTASHPTEAPSYGD